MLTLLGLIEVIIAGLLGWLCLKMVEVLERLNKMEGKFDSFPVSQIQNNRHRIEGLERHMEGVEIRLSSLEKVVDALKSFCNTKHSGNL